MKKILSFVFCLVFTVNSFSQTTVKRDSLRLIYNVFNYDNAFPILQKTVAGQVSNDASEALLITPEYGYFINVKLRRLIKTIKNPLQELEKDNVEFEPNELKVDWNSKTLEYEVKKFNEERDLYFSSVDLDDNDKKELYNHFTQVNTGLSIPENTTYKDIYIFKKKVSANDDYKEAIIYFDQYATQGYFFDESIKVTKICNYSYDELNNMDYNIRYMALDPNSRYIMAEDIENKGLKIIDLKSLKEFSQLLNFKLNDVLLINEPNDILNLSDSILNNQRAIENRINKSLSKYNLNSFSPPNEEHLIDFHKRYKTFYDDDYYIKPSIESLKNDSILVFKNKTQKLSVDGILKNIYDEFYEDLIEEDDTFLEDEEDMIRSASYMLYYAINQNTKSRYGLTYLYDHFTHFSEKNNVFEYTPIILLDSTHNNGSFSFIRNKLSYNISANRPKEDIGNTEFEFKFSYENSWYCENELFLLEKPLPNLYTRIDRLYDDYNSEKINFKFIDNHSHITQINLIAKEDNIVNIDIESPFGRGQLKLPRNNYKFGYIQKNNRINDIIKHYKNVNNLKSDAQLYEHYNKLGEDNVVTIKLDAKLIANNIPIKISMDFWTSYFNNEDTPIIGFSNNSRYILWNSQISSIYNSELLYLVDLKDKKIVGRFPFDYSKKIHYPSFHNDYKVLLMPLSENHFEVYDLIKQKKLADYYYYSESDWYVVTPEGLFDKSPNAKDNLYFVYGDKEIFELDQFKKEYKVNDLLNVLLGYNDKPLPKLLNLQNEIKKLPPIIDYQIIDNTVLSGTITKREGGVNNVFFTIAGSDKKEIPLDFNDQGISNFTLSLDEFNDSYVSDNMISVRATNSSNTISSNGPILNYTYKASLKDAQVKTSTYNPEAKLFALFVGIENYNNRKLEYAEDDATDMETCVDLINKKLYKNNPYIKSLTNVQATKDNIINELNYINDNARAQDVILLYFSGHGITGDALLDKQAGNNNFYFITENFNYVNKDYFSEIEIDNQFNSDVAISSAELMSFLSGENLYAQKKILIMDACYSGKLIEDNTLHSVKSDGGKLTAAQEKALRDLNTKTGTVVMTASRSDEKAYEDDIYQHSFLTWGLLKALKEKDFDDDNVNIGAWLSYAKYIVENQISNIQIQKPSVDFNKDFDFAIGSVKDNVLANFKLPSPLPLMNNAKINGDNNSFNSVQQASEIQSKISALLKEHSNLENTSTRVFTFRELDYKVTESGYRLYGSTSINPNTIELKYWLFKDGKPITLNKTQCNLDDENPQYCQVFYKNSLDEDIVAFTDDLINQVKAHQE
ncbi:caspase family protein [uncultured Psychroserpens sp.]|uniref:caspase family protein n=1 Tax=uncultured Psychroserpens sp. TaxID=255436 RepID=UPI0026182EF0|nr:caspase family protein [uncultured Psychroserpens sp.]